MPDLIAQGAESQQRWRRKLPEGRTFVLGRQAGVWAAPWDHQISRRHVELSWNGQVLAVQRLPSTKNPVFWHGRECERFAVRPGEHFVIGQTTFAVADQQADIASDPPAPMQQQSFSAQYLKQIQFRNPDYRLEVLSRLPDVISGAANDQELFVRLVSMLLAGIPRADAVAVVAMEAEANRIAGTHVLHWDQRLLITADFRPSRRLILEALQQGQSVLQVWSGGAVAGPEPYTINEDFDWAFCTPVQSEACPDWGLYVAGRFGAAPSSVTPSSDATDLREDVKFTELAAAMLSSLRHMRLLEHRQTTLSQFFSPVVLDSLSEQDPDVALAPRETEVSVLFCDLRGFSRESERQADDLLGLLQRVSTALGVTTHHIRAEGGVVGDLQGDAAMGFWGWPLPQPDAVLRTCRAALAIRAEFAASAGFHAGIGIATGRAVAGKIGTVDQVKVSVFGPVVNLASRLEGMTKILRAPILLDETTACIMRQQAPRAAARVRRLATLRPYGLDTPLEVSELLPPASQYPELTDVHLECYEAALDAFQAGEWAQALEFLHRIPADDQVKDFLVVYIAQRNRQPPPDWDGVIPLESK